MVSDMKKEQREEELFRLLVESMEKVIEAIKETLRE
jgi:hypothetical protein